MEPVTTSLEPLFARLFRADLERAYTYVDRLCLHLCFHALHECALLTAHPEPFESIAARIGLVPDAAYLLRAILDVLAEEEYAAHAEDGWRLVRPCPADESAELQREARTACPDALATFELIARCHDDAPAVLCGAKTGLAAIFPRGQTELWERLHSSDRIMSLYADLVPPVLDDILRPGARVLEIGAGVGAVARRLVPLLRERGVAEYWFTDLGALFVSRARQRYGHEPVMRYMALDIDRPLLDQGVPPDSFDSVIGVNVLHVARDLGSTLRDLRGALRAQGRLILAEGSPPSPQRRWRLDLIFAFLRGWWDVRLDPPLRPRPGFLRPSEWRQALLAHGFDRVMALPGEEWFAGPCRGGLIVATKDGAAP